MNKKINDLLNISDNPIEEKIQDIEVIENSDMGFEQDYNYSRLKIINAIDRVEPLLGEVIDIASSSQLPAHYDSVAKLLQVFVRSQDQLFNMSMKYKEVNINNIRQNTTVNNTQINNVVFTGSTANLQKMLKEIKDAG